MSTVFKVFVFALVVALVCIGDQYVANQQIDEARRLALLQLKETNGVAVQLQSKSWNMPIVAIHTLAVFAVALFGVGLFRNDLISLVVSKKEGV